MCSHTFTLLIEKNFCDHQNISPSFHVFECDFCLEFSFLGKSFLFIFLFFVLSVLWHFPFHVVSIVNISRETFLPGPGLQILNLSVFMQTCSYFYHPNEVPGEVMLLQIFSLEMLIVEAVKVFLLTGVM